MRKGAWVVALILGLISHPSPASADSGLEEVRRRIEALRSALTRSQAARGRVRDSLRASEERLSHTLERLHRLDLRIGRQRQEQARLTAHVGVEQNALAVQRHALSKETAVAYVLRRRNYWTMLLDQDHPVRARRMLVYYRYISGAQVQDIARIKAALAALTVTEDRLSTVSAELKALAADQWQEEHVLSRERARRAQALARIDRQVAGQQQQMVGLKADERRLRRLVDRLAVRKPYMPPRLPTGPFLAERAHLPPPLWIKGWRRLAQSPIGSHGAAGIFLPAPTGTPVHAVFAGRVVFAGWLRGFGLLLILEHEDGYMTIYAHVQSLYRRVGDRVASGEVVATVGRSGGFRRSGLYFEIRHDGQPLNPLTWLQP